MISDDATTSPHARTESDGQHVAVVGIGKRFGGVRALHNVSLEIHRGEIHGLVGENGAGKSTLGRLIQGAVSADHGELLVAGRRVRYHSPRDALRDGIAGIAQELVLVPQRSVLENVFLGVEHTRAGLLNRRALRLRYDELRERIGFELDADARVGPLPVAERQQVAILRALARDADFVVMDEPTAALTKDEAERLLAIARDLNEDGATILYISHFLEEVLSLVDRVTVLKDGALVRTSPVAQESVDSLVTAMLGRSLELAFPAKVAPPPDAPIVLSARGLNRPGAISDVDLDVRAGEIVGLAGLVGSGRSEVARAIFGADRRESGSIHLEGQQVELHSPRQAIKHGIALVPESRKDQGLLLGRPIIENVSLPHLHAFSAGGVLRRRTERSRVGQLLQTFVVRSSRPSAPVSTLSGGNQQKVLFARWLLRKPKLLIADEPTKGVDVGAKLAIYDLINRLAAEGMAVLLISSELEEVLGLAHRVLVMRGGRIVATLEGDAISEQAVIDAAFGASEAQVEAVA